MGILISIVRPRITFCHDQVKSIGVSNFSIEALEAIIKATGVIPVSRRDVSGEKACSYLNYDTGCKSDRGPSPFAPGRTREILQ
jgi:hypothetical protein